MAKVAFVIQRYGPEVIGGAESYCRQLAEKLVSELGWDVTVYTSSAIDYLSWKNHYPSTAQDIAGVSVVRFKTLMQRPRWLFRILNLIMINVWKASRRMSLVRPLQFILEQLWFRIQGPWVPQLLKQLDKDQDQFDRIIFVTYLYYPSIFGTRIAPEKTMLIPTAHDEPAFYSDLVQNMLTGVKSILCLTEVEQILVQTRLSEADQNKAVLLGYALDIAPAVQINATKTLKLPADISGTYMLYLGRISDGKNVNEMIRMFNLVKALLPRPVKLIVAGQLDPNFDSQLWSSDVIYVGRVSETEKDWLIQNSLGVINPSRYESLSLLVIEAMLYGKPALVNAECDVLDFYTKHTETVLGYRNAETFGAALHAIVDESQSNRQVWQDKINRTIDWSRHRFEWQHLLKRLQNAF